jgi:predicted secreted hydrolase
MIFDYDTYNKTGKCNYRISVQIDHIKVNLTFLQKTQGFKYITEYEGWTVAQPKAVVRGTLTIDDNIIPVQGRGYHDHNWNFSISTGLRSRGWYWGKVTSTNYTVTWANILTTPFYTNQIDENIAIINTLNEGFTNIHPENIVFSSNEKEYQNGRFIPTEFHLKIDQDDILVNVTFNAMSIQRGPPDFLTIHYWRYFVSVNGYIQVEGKRDQIQDMIQIIEYVRFI